MDYNQVTTIITDVQLYSDYKIRIATLFMSKLALITVEKHKCVALDNWLMHALKIYSRGLQAIYFLFRSLSNV